MSERTHYDVLGVSATATAQEIKSAYRKIVLTHHPDHSPSPASLDIFRKATESYEVLSDPERRTVYDDARERVRRHREEMQRPQPQPNPPARPRPQPSKTSEDLQRLARLFAQGRMGAAEELARTILSTDPRQALPYAVLGDLARSQGKLGQAIKMYAYAAQFDGSNPLYQRRYEQLMEAASVTTQPSSVTVAAVPPQPRALLVAAILVVACAVVGSLLPGPALNLPAPVGFWTLGLLGSLFMGGIALGAALSSGHWIDRLALVSTTASGRLSPILPLSLVALINFWAAALLYATLGASQRAFNYSSTRLMSGVGAGAIVFSLAACLSPRLNSWDVLLWSGNLLSIGALLGWLVSDSLQSGTAA